MGVVIEKILEWTLKKNQREREGAIFYLKSLLFLVLIVILLSDKFWDTSGSIKNLLSEKVTRYVFEISNIGIHFFTSLAIISFVVLIISAIICEITKNATCFHKYNNYFVQMRLGSEFRLMYSIEDVLLFLIIAYIFDKNVFQNYISTYSKFVLVVLGILCAFQFFTSSVVGIISRFFMLKPYDEMEE